MVVGIPRHRDDPARGRQLADHLERGGPSLGVIHEVPGDHDPLRLLAVCELHQPALPPSQALRVQIRQVHKTRGSEGLRERLVTDVEIAHDDPVGFDQPGIRKHGSLKRDHRGEEPQPSPHRLLRRLDLSQPREGCPLEDNGSRRADVEADRYEFQMISGGHHPARVRGHQTETGCCRETARRAHR